MISCLRRKKAMQAAFWGMGRACCVIRRCYRMSRRCRFESQGKEEEFLKGTGTEKVCRRDVVEIGQRSERGHQSDANHLEASWPGTSTWER